MWVSDVRLESDVHASGCRLFICTEPLHLNQIISINVREEVVKTFGPEQSERIMPKTYFPSLHFLFGTTVFI